MRDGENAETVGRTVPTSHVVIFFSLAIVGCAVDLVTKHLVFDWLGPPNPFVDNTHWIWEGYFGFQTSVNQGALFGIGQGMSGWFAALSIVAAVGILVWLFVMKAARDRLLTISLGCVTGGIFGNLYDRLGLWHAADAPAGFQNGVRDWILVEYGGRDLPVLGRSWPNFNIADSLLVCGAVLLFLHAFRHPAREKADDASPGSRQNG